MAEWRHKVVMCCLKKKVLVTCLVKKKTLGVTLVNGRIAPQLALSAQQFL